MMLSDVYLSVAYIGPKSRTERPRKTKIGTGSQRHVTLTPLSRSKGQMSRSQRAGHIVAASHTAYFVHRCIFIPTLYLLYSRIVIIFYWHCRRIKTDLLMCYKILHNHTCLNPDDFHTVYHWFHKKSMVWNSLNHVFCVIIMEIFLQFILLILGIICLIRLCLRRPVD